MHLLTVEIASWRVCDDAPVLGPLMNPENVDITEAVCPHPVRIASSLTVRPKRADSDAANEPGRNQCGFEFARRASAVAV
jgi:hypothetical protein